MTLKYLIATLLINLSFNPIFAQGHIEVIKNQEYLKNASSVDCNGVIDNQLSARICANLTFQKSDSVLTVIYNKLLKSTKGNKNQYKSIIQVQNDWRKLRDQHCGIVYDSYGKDAGSQQAIDYLNCLTEMTNSRTSELTKLYRYLK